MTWNEKTGCPHPSDQPLSTSPSARGHFVKASLAIAILLLMLGEAKPLWAESPAGSLAGRITFSGPSTPDQVIEITRDASFCGKTATIRTVAVNRATGGLEGAVVSVDATAIPTSESPLQPVVLANSRCAFSPQTVVARVGQPLEIRNDDPIMHNTHLKLDTRTFLNVALVPAGRPVVKPLKQPGVYEARCDAHRFMTASILALPHPFFSVTDGTGAFRIPHLPSGEHVITVWHRTLGAFQQRITIPVQGEAHVTIEYPANAGSHGK
jgi:plastocyanin